MAPNVCNRVYSPRFSLMAYVHTHKVYFVKMELYSFSLNWVFWTPSHDSKYRLYFNGCIEFYSLMCHVLLIEEYLFCQMFALRSRAAGRGIVCNVLSWFLDCHFPEINCYKWACWFKMAWVWQNILTHIDNLPSRNAVPLIVLPPKSTFFQTCFSPAHHTSAWTAPRWQLRSKLEVLLALLPRTSRCIYQHVPWALSPKFMQSDPFSRLDPRYLPPGASPGFSPGPWQGLLRALQGLFSPQSPEGALSTLNRPLPGLRADFPIPSESTSLPYPRGSGPHSVRPCLCSFPVFSFLCLSQKNKTKHNQKQGRSLYIFRILALSTRSLWYFSILTSTSLLNSWLFWYVNPSHFRLWFLPYLYP